MMDLVPICPLNIPRRVSKSPRDLYNLHVVKKDTAVLLCTRYIILHRNKNDHKGITVNVDQIQYELTLLIPPKLLYPQEEEQRLPVLSY